MPIKSSCNLMENIENIEENQSSKLSFRDEILNSDKLEMEPRNPDNLNHQNKKGTS